MELANNIRIVCFVSLRNYNHPRVCQIVLSWLGSYVKIQIKFSNLRNHGQQ